jgi:fructose-specific phosphotransferase system IIA component
MKTFSDILKLVRIKDLEATSKDEILVELCDMVKDAPEITSHDALIHAIRAREAIMSTGIGMGIAIPHAKTSSVTDFVIAIGRSKNGVDFQSHDGLPVYLFILIVASDTQGEDFLKILGKIGAFLNNHRNKEKVLKAKTARGIFSQFKKIDS